MFYKEISKYKTGKKIPTICTIVNSDATCTINLDEHRFPLGDLINDFIKHESKPFWKKDYGHKDITELYIKILNQLAFTYNF